MTTEVSAKVDKYSPIDLLKLFTGVDSNFKDDFIVSMDDHDGKETESATLDFTRLNQAFKSHEKWNQWLTYCARTNNINELVSVKYRLQLGMDRLVKQKLNNQKISMMFVRWQASIDNTIRSIIRAKYPKPHDADGKGLLKWQKIKKQRENELEKYLRKVSF